MVFLDKSLVVREANSDFEQEFGRYDRTLRGQKILQFVHRSAWLHLEQQLEKLIEGKYDRVSEHLPAMHKNDEVVQANFTATAVRARSSGLICILVILQSENFGRREKLSLRDRQVLNQLDAKILESVAAGVSSVRIASKLHLIRQGVEYHVGAMMRKLNAPNRAALVSRAYSIGILSIGAWPPKVQPEFVK